MPLPHDPGPHWGEVGIHGLHRQREWDHVVAIEAPGLPGDEAWFVALPGGRLILEEGAPALEPLVLADALDLEPPYRAHAVRRGTVWTVAARRINIVEVARDPGGNEIEIVWDGGERAVRIDGLPTLAEIPELEVLGAHHEQYVVTARRLDGRVWEASAAAL